MEVRSGNIHPLSYFLNTSVVCALCSKNEHLRLHNYAEINRCSQSILPQTKRKEMPLAIHIMQVGAWLGDQCELCYLLYMNSCYVILLTLIIINNLRTISTL